MTDGELNMIAPKGPYATEEEALEECNKAITEDGRVVAPPYERNGKWYCMTLCAASVRMEKMGAQLV